MSEESEIWDAIVIGGGPAGSTTARYIAEGGKRVLVLDGRDSIGSPLPVSYTHLTLPTIPLV